MQKIGLIAATSALALVLGACGSGEEASNQAAANEMNAVMADGSNPFADAELQMNERMMAAVGTDVGDNWARKMIEHHQGAIQMSEIVLQQNPTADVAEVARMTIEKQRKEIEDIRKLLKDGAPNQQSAELYRPAMTDMHQKMMVATGADVSETFMRKMLEHHRGGVAMSDVALQNGVTGALRQQVEKTRSDQQKDAKMIEAMLRGESMTHAQESEAKPAEEARAEPAAEKARPAAQPTRAAPKAPPPKTTPPARPTPPTEPKADPTCTPEHREMGHC
ncbi:MAG TPA: DUF305 domain-containing protein [Sphingomicrobium sp.]|nr:DUF305 domain-containing protein [Sphingomicrobium sp.]